MSENEKTNKNDLLDWYWRTFVVDPGRGYAVMNPPHARAKYSRKHEICAQDIVDGGFAGGTRRLFIKDTWQTFPLALAVTPEHRDGWAHIAAIDIDGGGAGALRRVLDGLQSLGLWAFAQIGKSADHTGGHVYIPTAKLPTGILFDFATEIIRRFDVKGEAYPCNSDLRLPLMYHLHAPDGPHRYPLMMQGGQLIDASDDPWAAMAALHQQWQANTPEAITSIIPTQLSTEAPQQRRKPVHTSKVKADSSTSVINWYNARFDLADRFGQTRGAVRCPWHDDKNPSLYISQHRDGRTVCRCLSQNSDCPASDDKGYWDAFNVYCHEHNLSTHDAIRTISEEYNLGNRRRFKTKTIGQKEPCVDALIEHHKLVDRARDQLRVELDRAAASWGKATVIKGTPGIGKTHSAARLANRLHNQGKTVSIVAPSHSNAIQEWAPRLDDAFVWRSRQDICTCYDSDYMHLATSQGYILPKCKNSDCPYEKQHEQRQGKIAIYQHNHTHIQQGKLLAGSDVVIVDESLVGALLEERSASLVDLTQLLNHMRIHQSDPASIALVDALIHVGSKAQQERTSLSSDEIIKQLVDRMGRDNLIETIEKTQASQYGKPLVLAPSSPGYDLPRQYLGRLLVALSHDLHDPTNNPLLAFTQSSRWTFSWYKRNSFLESLQGKLTSPSVIILDGSASEIVYQKLISPWQVEIVEIRLPLSPMTRVIQCTATSSTRKLVQDQDLTRRTLRQVAQVCNELDIVLDGGITYKDIAKEAQEMLGGIWLHYGGQRGSNALAGEKAIALIASPTAPPDAIERKTQALYCDEPRIDIEWKQEGVGYFSATEPRLDAMNNIHGMEELHQSIQRARPILAHTQSTILICSPWPLQDIGITPHTTITELPHGNSTEAQSAPSEYKARAKALHTGVHRADRGGGKGEPAAIKSANSIRESSQLSPGLTPPEKLQIVPVPLIVNTGLNSAKKLQLGTKCKPELPQHHHASAPVIPPPFQPHAAQVEVLSEAQLQGWPCVSVLGKLWEGREGWQAWSQAHGLDQEQVNAAERALRWMQHGQPMGSSSFPCLWE